MPIAAPVSGAGSTTQAGAAAPSSAWQTLYDSLIRQGVPPDQAKAQADAVTSLQQSNFQPEVGSVGREGVEGLQGTGHFAQSPATSATDNAPVNTAAPPQQPRSGMDFVIPEPINYGQGEFLQGDLDLTGKGPEEQFWDQIRNQLLTPSAFEGNIAEGANVIRGSTQFSNNLGRMLVPGLLQQGMGQQNIQGLVPQINQRMGHMATQQAFDAAMQNRPDLALSPGLDPYYDNQRRRAQEQIDQTMAARGAFGSSAAGDMIGEMNVNLAAEQANREADYALARAAEMRQMDQVLGNLGIGADTAFSNLAGLSGELGLAGEEMQKSSIIRALEEGDRQAAREMMRGQGLVGAGSAGSGAELNRLTTGITGAGSAGAGMRGRIGLLGDSIFRGVDMAQGAAGDVYNQMTKADQQALDNLVAQFVGEGKAFLDLSVQEQNQLMGMLGLGAQVAPQIAGAFGGGGGTGGGGGGAPVDATVPDALDAFDRYHGTSPYRY